MICCLVLRKMHVSSQSMTRYTYVSYQRIREEELFCWCLCRIDSQITLLHYLYAVNHMLIIQSNTV